MKFIFFVGFWRWSYYREKILMGFKICPLLCTYRKIIFLFYHFFFYEFFCRWGKEKSFKNIWTSLRALRKYFTPLKIVWRPVTSQFIFWSLQICFEGIFTKFPWFFDENNFLPHRSIYCFSLSFFSTVWTFPLLHSARILSIYQPAPLCCFFKEIYSRYQRIYI